MAARLTRRLATVPRAEVDRLIRNAPAAAKGINSSSVEAIRAKGLPAELSKASGGSRRPKTRRAMIGVAVAALSGVAWTQRSQESRHATTLAINSAIRSGITFYAAAHVSYDYKMSLRNLERGTDEYRAVQREVHQRSATRILGVCRANRGFYTKAGQQIASMNHALPPEYTKTLAVLQDDAPVSEPGAIDRVFESEFHAAPEDIFAEFDREPIAAASLAQVHVATTKDGEKVAVKVQYPDLEENFGTDIWALYILSDLTEWMFDDLSVRWIVDEIQLGIMQELNFVREGRNAERIAGYFAHIGRDDIYVPTIRWKTTTRKVLTMEFIDGVKINDLDGLRGLGIDPKAVAKILVETFAAMVFCIGYVHGDPHPGNVMVRRDSKGAPQMVLLDHGLYRDLDEAFRINYCNLWKAMITIDTELLVDSATKLGAGEFAEIFPLIFTYRSWNSPAKPGHMSEDGSGEERVSKEDRKRLKEKYGNTTFADVVDFLEGLPRDILLVMKTFNLVRSINLELGGTSLQRFDVNARFAMEGLYTVNGRLDGAQKWAYRWDQSRVRFNLWVADRVVSLFQPTATTDALPLAARIAAL